MPVPIRIPVPVLDFPATDFWKTESVRVVSRDEGRKNRETGLVVAGIVGGILLLGFTVYAIRNLRKRHPTPKYIPTSFLKKLWTDWKVTPKRRDPHRYQHADEEDADTALPRTGHNMRTTLRAGLRNPETRQATAGAGDRRTESTAMDAAAAVDRNTSVRSVMTLPAYRINATDNEQVLGREGERGGIDVVVEMPTAEDDEASRENEMSTLYQIRLARRRQIEEREERRRLRREARQRNDPVALEEIRRQTRQAPGSNTTEVEELRREHERIKASRQRAVSSVSYDGLGIARADGTRLRANSTESERVGLLSDAASIAPSARSASAAGQGPFHTRDRSASSVISIDTAHSPPASPSLTTLGSSYSLASAGRTRSRSRGNSTGRTTPRAGSSPEIIDAEEADLGEADMPPGYDDVSLEDLSPQNSRSGANSPYNEPPPDYPGPTQTRNNRLSAHTSDVAAEASGDDGESRMRRTSRGVGGAPQLPSLRLSRVPQIVIEPSTAHPDH